MEGGFLTPQYLLAVGLGLVFLVLVANLIVFQYGRGVLRTALDDAARAGARTLSGDARVVERCRSTAERVRGDLLGGALGESVTIRCGATPARVTATAEATFQAWLPPAPAWRFTLEASVPREVLP